jgi:phosphopantothenoylcysteine decarboxylase/phosphopantothenate--cysteine ligase
MRAAFAAALRAEIAVLGGDVADWRAVEGGKNINTRPGEPPQLVLIENPDILAELAVHATRPELLIGFAAETENVVDNALAKLARKGCDWIVANDVSPESGVMGGQRNRVHLVTHAGVEDWPEMSKTEVAARLVARIATHFASAGPGVPAPAAEALAPIEVETPLPAEKADAADERPTLPGALDIRPTR